MTIEIFTVQCLLILIIHLELFPIQCDIYIFNSPHPVTVFAPLIIHLQKEFCFCPDFWYYLYWCLWTNDLIAHHMDFISSKDIYYRQVRLGNVWNKNRKKNENGHLRHIKRKSNKKERKDNWQWRRKRVRNTNRLK